VLLLDPLAPLAAGFWLSFVAVGVLMFLGSGAMTRVPSTAGSKVRSVVAMQIGVMTLLAPLTVAVFGGISLAGLVVNLVAIPVISFVFVPLVLAGAVGGLLAPSLAAGCFRGAALLYEHLWPGLVAAADADFSLWRVTPDALWFVVALIGGILALRRWPLALRLTGLAALLPLLYPPDRAPAPGVARIEVLDAGRGAAVLVETHSRLWLFDTGDSWGSAGSRARQIVQPALGVRSRGVDELVLPALDPDRAAGVALLAIERVPGAVRAGRDWPGSELPVQRCRDSTFDADGVRIDLMSGGPGFEFCAWRVSVGDHAVLAGGDFDAAAERALIARLGTRRLASDAVILSRYASALGSSRQWIEASGAAVAIAAGGIESASRGVALERWRHAGARILDTRVDGALVFELGRDGLSVEGRARYTRYPFAWRRLP
jgi:competence protein ComEC